MNKLLIESEEQILKPIIGVSPLWDDKLNSIWMLPEYMDCIRESGGIPVIFPLTANEDDLCRLIEMCDGFLLTGGHDVSPKIYGEKPMCGLISCCEERDKTESVILENAIKNDKPLLGICRGIQFINAKLGGTLYQDIPSQYPTKIEHHQHAPYDIPCHGVEIAKNTPLYNCLKAENILVNSYHHQAVKQPAPALEIMARSSDGLAEALYMPNRRFLWAVQWHPEFLYKKDVYSRKIFDAFTASIK